MVARKLATYHFYYRSPQCVRTKMFNGSCLLQPSSKRLYKISKGVFCYSKQRKKGWELDGREIADLMLKLQNETKCHNINLVTPEHVVPQVIEAIYYAVEGGLNLPIVYNTSSYDSMKSLQVQQVFFKKDAVDYFPEITK